MSLIIVWSERSIASQICNRLITMTLIVWSICDLVVIDRVNRIRLIDPFCWLIPMNPISWLIRDWSIRNQFNQSYPFIYTVMLIPICWYGGYRYLANFHFFLLVRWAWTFWHSYSSSFVGREQCALPILFIGDYEGIICFLNYISPQIDL